MQQFNGFPPGKTRNIRVPHQFFSELMFVIDDLVELKLTLYCLWALQQQDGEFPFVTQREILDDEMLLRGIDPDDADHAREQIVVAMQRAVERGTLLRGTVQGDNGPEDLYFLNTPRGRNAIRSIEAGHYHFGGRDIPIALFAERPNIYHLYEQNIGLLTPMISDALREAEQEFPTEWIEEAIRLSVERNARNWRYIRRILERWTAEGKDHGTAQQPTEADRYRYIKGEYSDYIEY
ncbi:MAG: DnaD domain protein [Chloroflexi bacterium]|nr:DnaD domain protein [Chloroflexota bacterium]